METYNKFRGAREDRKKFNIYLAITGALTLFINWSLPYGLQHIHECAKYIEIDVPVLAIAFFVLGILANLIYGCIGWIMIRLIHLKPYRHPLLCWLLLVSITWLMLNGILVNELPVVFTDPDLLCD